MPKVLVVEDDARVASVVRHILETDGYVFFHAGDAETAWREMVAEAPDAAVVDIRLPGADGWSFIERIRGDGRFHALAIVVLTGLHDPDVMARAKDLHAEFLEKPFSGEALLDRLRKAMASAGKVPLEPARQRVDLVARSVIMLLGEYRVEGIVHLPSELPRFSDGWESVVRDARIYVPVTEAKVTTHDGATVASSEFVQVRKTDIRAVYPVD
ncbi:MAG TPA: response regulator [Actinomycetota bacterium]